MFDRQGRSDGELMAALREAEKRVAAAQADQLVAIAELYTRCPNWTNDPLPGCPGLHPVEVTAAEVGPALALSKLVATDRVELAVAATARLPRSVAALGQGRLSLGKLRILIEHTAGLSQDNVAAVEEQVLPRAAVEAPSVFGARVRRAVLRIDPAAARARIEKAVTGRSVELYPAADGMAVLRANLPAPQGLRAHQLLTAAARAGRNAATDGDDRTMDARRADALIDCLEQLDPDPLPAPAATADADSAGHAYRPLSRRWHPGPVNLHVTVPLGTLLGLNDGPGELTGYGPIDADTARYLAEEATWRRILTDPATGAVLDVGTTSYHPPADLDAYVRTRDQTCRFPNGRQPAGRADLDHTRPFPHGLTAEDNLAALCRPHHRIKTLTSWQLKQLGGGRLEWTSPTGQTYLTDPPPAHPPEPADDENPEAA